MLGRNRVRLGKVGALICIGFFVLVYNSCEDKIIGPGNDIVFPDTGIVSYSQHVQPLFHFKCNFSGCHGSDTYTTRGWDLTEYGRFAFSGQGIVIAGDTVNSKLIRSVKGLPPSPLMPPDAPLPQNQIRGLTRWVQQGARQDT